MLGDFFVTALLSVAALFFVVDPIGLVPIFVALTEGKTHARRTAIARKAALIFVALVSFFAVGGGLLFRTLGISLAAFKIAGGLLLMLTALDMMRGHEPVARTTDGELDEASQKQDIAVVPLAMPLLAGPGAIATVMVLTSRARNLVDVGIVILAVVITGIATYGILAASTVVARVLGKGGRSILERVMGLVLAAIAVQFVIDGIGEALPGTLGLTPEIEEQQAPEGPIPGPKAELPGWLDLQRGRG
ncbi:MAG TPA: MarC family protein [Vulgatibacter sp.]